MEKAINIFVVGVILLGSALLRTFENIIHWRIPLWLLYISGTLIALYGVLLYSEKHPSEKKNGE